MSEIMISEEVKELLSLARCWQMVGSRVTCSPAPVGTDQDILVLVEECEIFLNEMRSAGFDVELGERYAEDALCSEEHDRFQSYRLGDTNIIATADDNFYRKFAAATSIAKALNLTCKGDRIDLFQAVLYGNACDDSLPEPWPPREDLGDEDPYPAPFA